MDVNKKTMNSLYDKYIFIQANIFKVYVLQMN